MRKLETRTQNTLVFATFLLLLFAPFWLHFTLYPFRTLLPFGCVALFFFQKPYCSWNFAGANFSGARQTNLKGNFSALSPQQSSPGARHLYLQSFLGARHLYLSLLVLASLGYFVVLSFLGSSQKILCASLAIPCLQWLWMWWYLGKDVAQVCVFPLLFLVFFLPGWQWESLIPSAKAVHIWLSSFILRFLQPDVLAQAEGIWVGKIYIAIHDQCAGLNFLSKLLLFAFLLLGLGKFSWRKKVLLLLVSPVIAIFANSFRIVSYCLVARGMDISPQGMQKWDVVMGSFWFLGSAFLFAFLALRWQSQEICSSEPKEKLAL